MRVIVIFAAALCGIIVQPNSAIGQQRALGRFDSADLQRSNQLPTVLDSMPRPSVDLYGSGALAATAGLLLGGLMGAQLDPGEEPQTDLTGALVGMAMGPAVLIPAAVHHRSGGSGSFLRTAAVPAVLGAATAGALTLSDPDALLGLLVVVPVLEVVWSVTSFEDGNGDANER